MQSTFDEVITTPQRLREIMGEPRGYSAQKGIDHIDSILKRFIEATPFVLVATHGADGLLDISPKGDPAGFVEVLDEKTLIVPDRLGNQRLDSFTNLLTSPAIALLFIIPGNAETLRVAGHARIVRDRALQKRLAVNGKEPNLCLVVDVDEAFMHCAKSMVRSKLWKPEEWPDRSGVPTMMESVKANAKAIETVEELQKGEDIVTVTRLY